jgi:hypothetical protein
MGEDRSRRDEIEQRLKATEERFRIAQVAGGIGWFEWDLVADAWECTPHVAVLFGFDSETPPPIWGLAIGDLDRLAAYAESKEAEARKKRR